MTGKEFSSTLDCSIIIVNFKDYKMIDNCIESIITNTESIKYEIIVVDNASVGYKIDKLGDKYQCVKIIKNKENRGFAAANNQGISIAKGKYLLLLNNDTLFLENSLKKIIDFAQCKQDDLVIGCKVLNADKSRQVSVWEFDNVLNSISESLFIYKLFPTSKLLNRFYLNYLDIKEPVEVDAVKGCFLFCSSYIAKRLNGLDERFYFYMEETDFCYRLKKAGGKVYFFPGTEIIHLDGASTENVQWFKFKNQAIAKIQFFQKHACGLKFFLLLFTYYLGIFLRVFVYLAIGGLRLKKYMLRKSFYYLMELTVYPENLFNKKKKLKNPGITT